MTEIATARIIISGVSSGVGKSFFTLGLLQELRRRGLSVSCCVVGPSLIEASILRRLSGRYVRTLDDRLLTAEQNLQSLAQASIGSDLILIEGKEGLYDGSGAGTVQGSDAELAALSATPVILVANAKGFGTSIVALLRGYAAMASNFSLAGLLLNRVDGEEGDGAHDRHFFEATLQAAGMRDALVGALPEIASSGELLGVPVSQQKNYSLLPRQFLVELATLVRHHVNIDQIIQCARTARALEVGPASVPAGLRKARIAVSDDSCFNVSFQDNFDLLRFHGAELVPFSPLADQKLPKNIGAIFLSGASLAEYASELASNKSMHNAVLDFVKAGGMLYSEGGGSAYLCQQFSVNGSEQWFSGVGLLPGRAVAGPLHQRYVEMRTSEDTILGPPGMRLSGIFTDEWRFEHRSKIVCAFQFNGASTSSEGYSPGAQVVSTFGLLQFASQPLLAKSLVDGATIRGAVGA